MKRCPGWWLWLTVILITAQTAVANETDTPPATLRGRVLESDTDRPIPLAMIVLSFTRSDTVNLDPLDQIDGQFVDANNLITYADTTGAFTFRGLPPGEVELSFPNLGFAPLAVTRSLEAGELKDETFHLRPESYTEDELVVYGRGPETEVSRQSLSQDEVQRIPGFGGDAVKSIQALPGVARPVMTDPGAIVIRGSGNYDTRFFLDGVDIPLLFHFGGVKSTYNSLSLGSVDLYPGGFGTRFGGCVGGVVELKGRPARTDGWRTILDASLLDVSFHTEGPLGKGWGLAVSGRRSFVGELASAALKDNDDIDLAVAPFYWDAVARLDYDTGGDHTFFLTLFAANDRLKLILNDDSSGSPAVDEATDEVEADLAFSRLILGYDAWLGDRVRNELRVAAGRDRSDFHLLGEFRFEGAGPVYSLRDDLAITWKPEVVSHVGVDMVYTPLDYEVVVNGYAQSTLEDKEFGDLGFYTNVDLRPLPDLLITPGIRYDYYPHLNKGKASVRALTRWDYRDDRTVTASAGTYNQAPQPIGQSTDPIYGNPDLPPTTARHLTLGHEWRLGNRVSFKVEGYHNTQDLVPAFADTADLNFLPDAEARMYGLEFMLRHAGNDGFFGWISYSIGRSQRRFSRDPGNGGTWDPAIWNLHDMDQTHHLEAVGSWDIGKNWTFGSRVQYVSGVPVTPILGFIGTQYEFDGDLGEYVPVEGEYHSDRVEPYFRTDLRVEKKFFKGDTVWSLYLDLQNANYFAYNSPEGYTYNYDYSKREAYGWIFVPALGARVEF